MIHPLLTAYIDAIERHDADNTVESFHICVRGRNEWFAANRPRLADDSTFLTALRGDLTGGPHISPDAPPEVWRAWRNLNSGVSNG